MSSIQDLREERNEKAREYRNLLDKQPEDTKIPKEVQDTLDTLIEDIDRLDSRVKAEEKILDRAADDLAKDQAREAIDKDPKSPSALLAKWMIGGDNALTAEDWQVVRNTMSTGVGSEGGYTVDTELAKDVLEALEDFGGMREVATVIHTAQGNPINWPTTDGTSEEGEIVDENASASDENISFGIKSFPVYKFSSKVVTVPIELLQDSSFNLNPFINGRLAQRLARSNNKYFTVGTGVNQPEGIVTASSQGAIAAAVDEVAWEELVDLEHSVDPAYRKFGCRFMFHDDTLRDIKKMKDNQGRPLWMPDIIGSEPATFLKYGYTINQDMSPMAAAAKSMLFGRLSEYVIRDVMAIIYHRFTDSAYAKKGQVGFLAFMRAGGALMDVGGAVKHMKQASS